MKNISRKIILGAVCAMSSAAFARPYTFDRLISSATPVPNQPGAVFTSFLQGGVDAAGTAFIGTYTIAGTSYSGLYRFDTTGALQVIADQHTTLPNGGVADQIIGTGDFTDGNLVFAAGNASGQSMYRYSPSGLTLLIQHGDILPGNPTPITTFQPKGIQGDASRFSFGAARADTTSGLYHNFDNTTIQFADDETRAPGPELGNFVDFPEIHYRDGRTVFVGRSLETDRADAIVEPAGVFFAMPGNNVSAITVRNRLIPGRDYRFNEFEKPRIDMYGRITFHGGFINEEDPLSGERYMGVYAVNPDGTWKEYVNSEMDLDGLDEELLEFNGYSFDSGVTVIGGVDILGETYIWVDREVTGPNLLISSLGLLDGKALSSIKLGGDIGMDGTIVIRAVFEDGTAGLYSVEVPEPTSVALLAIGTMVLSRRRRA